MSRKQKLAKGDRPKPPGFFEKKHIDIIRSGDTLVLQDTYGYEALKDGEWVEPLRYVSFQDCSGNKTMIDVVTGEVQNCSNYNSIPSGTEENKVAIFGDPYNNNYSAPRPYQVTPPMFEPDTEVTVNSVAVVAESVAEQVMRQDPMGVIAGLRNEIEELRQTVLELQLQLSHRGS